MTTTPMLQMRATEVPPKRREMHRGSVSCWCLWPTMALREGESTPLVTTNWRHASCTNSRVTLYTHGGIQFPCRLARILALPSLSKRSLLRRACGGIKRR